MGLNSITIYVVHEVFVNYFPLSFKNNGSHTLAFVSNYTGILSMLILAGVLDYNQIYIKV